VSLPPPRADVVQLAVPTRPTGSHVTAVLAQPEPVFALHATVPVTSIGFRVLRRPLTKLFSALIVAVNVTDCAYVEGFGVELTLVVVDAPLMEKLLEPLDAA